METMYANAVSLTAEIKACLDWLNEYLEGCLEAADDSADYIGETGKTYLSSLDEMADLIDAARSI